ncbi:MAG: transposase [Clostridia bacterium]
MKLACCMAINYKRWSDEMDLPKRKPTRLKEYDYSTTGMYFITICVKDKKQLLSKIVVGDGVLDVPKNILTEHGIITDRYINQMNSFYDYISVDKYVIMPNHIHLLLSIRNAENVMWMTNSPTNSTVPKFVSTLKRFCNKEYGQNIWQRSYHDHIIRGENDYRKIWEYIDTNVIRWEKDCFYTDENE